MNRVLRKRAGAEKQRGAVAIEFAVLFMVFFALLYAIIAYSIPFLLTLSFKQISADAARASVRVSPVLPTEEYLARINRQVHEAVADSWLPKNWVQGGCPAPDAENEWLELKSIDGKSFGHYLEVPGAEPFSHSRYHLNVCLQRKYNKGGGTTDGAIIPALSFLGVDIPSLPKEGTDTILRGRSTIRL